VKNLMIYINPSGTFHNEGFNVGWEEETGILAKVQIDNSLEMGWDRKDIMLVTNFAYEHNGVEALVVPSALYCEKSPTASKVYAIIHLFETGMIEDGELYWFHDFDAFQLADIREEEVGLNGCDLGLTDYGRSSVNPGRDLRWSTGTLFFRKSAYDIFIMLRREIELYKTNEEIALLEMLKKGRHRATKERIKKVNITYNLATRRRLVSEAYGMADKPLRVIHFHPFDKRPLYNGEDNMNYCVYGKNSLGHPLVTDRLARILREHGIK
jgi:hypothetical protein